MRYLNRIFLINSAQVKYAEIKLDGNVHFIGTQGVGKSTLLRAILFFYNADTLRLGIPRSKKSFLEYYFPYSNSYIIYEVARPNGAYCVLAYKASNKVCFRFIDGEYAREYFITTESKAQESWTGIANQLDSSGIYYTKKKIDSYNDYRDILYGNNSGKAKELKRYALLESKDYQNIPRTIQNVFLNSELKAEFIKDTIIKSLGNDIKIDLSNYTHHLKGFELQLSEIRRFREPKTIAQANEIAKLHIAIRHLEAEKIRLTKSLAWALDENQKREPELSKSLETERAHEERLKAKLNRAEEIFLLKEKKAESKISVLNNYLKEARIKANSYAEMNIDSIMRRVLQKPDLEKENRDLSNERILLTAQFQELNQKFQALQQELENQLNEFFNLKEKEKLAVNSSFQDFKNTVTDDFENRIAEIRAAHSAEVEDARAELDAKKEITKQLEINKEQIKQKRFYEAEIENQREEIRRIKENWEKAKTASVRLKGQVETIQKQWELSEENTNDTEVRNREQLEEKTNTLVENLKEVNGYIKSSKTSFYGWLSDNHPGWEHTIGKVVDEKNVLFNSDLSPKRIEQSSTSFFGIELDLNEIDKEVKTLADYELDKQGLIDRIERLRQSITDLSKRSAADRESFKKKYRPKIREAKDGIKEREYVMEQSAVKVAEATVNLQDHIVKARKEKEEAMAEVEAVIDQSTEEEIVASDRLRQIEMDIAKRIKTKLREKKAKIAEQKQELDEALAKIDREIAAKKAGNDERRLDIHKQQENEMANKGADTGRLSAIDQLLEKNQEELEFIEQNRDSVAEYKKDKRELLDKVADFKSEKKTLETKLDQEKHRYNIQNKSIKNDLSLVKTALDALIKTLGEIAEDKAKFEEFKASSCYATIVAYFDNELEKNSGAKRAITLIDEIKEVHYDKLHRRVDVLRRTVTGFLGKFSEDNIFKFKKRGDDTAAFLEFAEDLSDFIEEDKIEVLEKVVNEHFAFIIQTIGKETTDLVSQEGEIQRVISKINRDFVERNFAGVIKKIALMLDQSKNEVVQLLKFIKNFSDENALELGQANLFSSDTSDAKNQKAIDLLKQFVKKIGEMRKDEITLSDSFELKFRIEENENDTGWVEKLSNVGSEGTDVLVKAMINIMLLNVFKEGASRRFKDFQLHCMMDEIGKLHPNNVRGILKFANDRNILLINSSPTENDALAFKHIYKLEKDKKSITKVKRIITQHSHA